jgi:hypothetical protein
MRSRSDNDDRAERMDHDPVVAAKALAVWRLGPKVPPTYLRSPPVGGN